MTYKSQATSSINFEGLQMKLIRQPKNIKRDFYQDAHTILNRI